MYGVDINYFFSPEMTLEEAELLDQGQENFLSRMDKIASFMETKLRMNENQDINEQLTQRPALARIVNLISKESDETLSGLEGLVYGFLASHKK
jgi:hypothetical protein